MQFRMRQLAEIYKIIESKLASSKPKLLHLMLLLKGSELMKLPIWNSITSAHAIKIIPMRPRLAEIRIRSHINKPGKARPWAITT